MKLAEMFEGQDAATFEQRRDEVVAIMSSAVDLAGIDQGLTALMQRLTTATDDTEFDEAYDEIVAEIRETTPELVDLA